MFVGLAASLAPTHAVPRSARTRGNEATIDATAIVLPEIVATPRRTAVRDSARLLPLVAAMPVLLLLVLLAMLVGLALGVVASDPRFRVTRFRTRAPPRLSLVA